MEVLVKFWRNEGSHKRVISYGKSDRDNKRSIFLFYVFKKWKLGTILKESNINPIKSWWLFILMPLLNFYSFWISRNRKLTMHFCKICWQNKQFFSCERVLSLQSNQDLSMGDSLFTTSFNFFGSKRIKKDVHIRFRIVMELYSVK